ncbi:hypothetical protein QBC35DRAFT_130363 [Podospora australis]|uniref:Infection structure specific protein n=1 Tax=Podospora australis TaxID=1536484 RepID=A0AAN7AEL1_9PEZI|nr:hypothetical protein QBC35DRAFT_130363 [Podospora australis]
MLTRTVLLATMLSASAVVATNFQEHLNIKRYVEARQTRSGSDSDGDDDDTNATACLTAVFSLLSSVPTPPAGLVSELTRTDITNACEYTPPPALAGPYSSWTQAVLSWYGDNGDRVSSALKDCPGNDNLESLTDVDAICSTRTGRGNNPGATQTTGFANVQTTGLGGGADTDDDDDATSTGAGNGPTGTGAGAGVTSSQSTAGVARETGFAAAAMAAAGFLGAVAAL